MTEPILIVGTGAMACLFAAKLSRAGIPVTMLGTWKEGLAALGLYGVTLVETDGSQSPFPVKVVDESKKCVPTKHALVLVKSWQTERAAKQLKKCLAKDGVALTLQNGLGNREKLEIVLGKERVASGVMTMGATLLSSGRVRDGGKGTISIENHPKMKAITESFLRAGLEINLVDNIDSLIWSKLAINAAINPITALLKISNGKLLSRASAKELFADLANEVAQVAKANKISLSYADPVAAATEIAERTALNHSSMLQDIQRGAETEIDAICGEVVRRGQALGVPTPVNYTVWKLIKAVIEGSAGP